MSLDQSDVGELTQTIRTATQTERQEKYTSRSPEVKPNDDSLQPFSGSDLLSSTENRGTPSPHAGLGDVSQRPPLVTLRHVRLSHIPVSDTRSYQE